MYDLEEISTLAFFTVLRDDLTYLEKIGQKPTMDDYPHLYKLVNFKLIDKLGDWVNEEVSIVESLGFIVTRIAEEVHLLVSNTRLKVPLYPPHLDVFGEESIMRKLLTA